MITLRESPGLFPAGRSALAVRLLVGSDNTGFAASAPERPRRQSVGRDALGGEAPRSEVVCRMGARQARLLFQMPEEFVSFAERRPDLRQEQRAPAGAVDDQTVAARMKLAGEFRLVGEPQWLRRAEHGDRYAQRVSLVGCQIGEPAVAESGGKAVHGHVLDQRPVSFR